MDNQPRGKWETSGLKRAQSSSLDMDSSSGGLENWRREKPGMRAPGKITKAVWCSRETGVIAASSDTGQTLQLTIHRHHSNQINGLEGRNARRQGFHWQKRYDFSAPDFWIVGLARSDTWSKMYMHTSDEACHSTCSFYPSNGARYLHISRYTSQAYPRALYTIPHRAPIHWQRRFLMPKNRCITRYIWEMPQRG